MNIGEHPGDHNHQDFPNKSTAIQMGGVLQYKWEAYCDTNGRSTDSLSLSLEPRGTESTAIQVGGVLRYKWEVYCDTFLRSSGGWGFRLSSEIYFKISTYLSIAGRMVLLRCEGIFSEHIPG